MWHVWTLLVYRNGIYIRGGCCGGQDGVSLKLNIKLFSLAYDSLVSRNRNCLTISMLTRILERFGACDRLWYIHRLWYMVHRSVHRSVLAYLGATWVLILMVKVIEGNTKVYMIPRQATRPVNTNKNHQRTHSIKIGYDITHQCSHPP